MGLRSCYCVWCLYSQPSSTLWACVTPTGPIFCFLAKTRIGTDLSVCSEFRCAWISEHSSEIPRTRLSQDFGSIYASSLPSTVHSLNNLPAFFWKPSVCQCILKLVYPEISSIFQQGTTGSQWILGSVPHHQAEKQCNQNFQNIGDLAFFHKY